MASAPYILKEATAQDADTILGLLAEMIDELKEFTAEPAVVRDSVTNSFEQNVHWFLFVDAASGKIFGTCHLQSVFNYWRREKRFYLGGFFIQPEFRGTGAFKALFNQLRAWAEAHDGVQIYAHIHEDNHKSRAVFKSVGVEPVEYNLSCLHWGT